MVALLSIVVPCYREAQNLPRLRDELKQTIAELGSPTDVELILVDDGSPDNTFAVATALARQDPHIRVISFSRNFGKEAAMLAGLRAARGDAVVIMDADLQHPPAMIKQMLDALQTGTADQVIARRSRHGDPRVRTGLSRLYYRLVNAMIDVELQDGVGDFRMLSRRAVDALLALPESNRFSKGLFAWIGFPVTTLEYDNVGRNSGESAWTLRTLVNYGIDGIISFNDRPLRIMTGIGAVATGLGVAYLVVLLIQWLGGAPETPGYFTTIAVVTMFGGIQLITSGIMAEYVGRIYSEAKRRPHYIIASDLSHGGDGHESEPDARPGTA